jgi:hypothetical protein
MNKAIYKLAATTGAIAIAASVMTASAVTLARAAATQKAYTTTLTEVMPSPLGYAWTGTLKLTVSPEGIVHGWYIPDAEASFIPVTGNLKHAKLWLDVGMDGSLQINADMHRNGKLVGSATDLSTAHFGIPVTYKFEANPTTYR